MDRPLDDPETQRALRLFVVLARCTNSVFEHARDDIQQHDLKPSEFAVLEMLYHKGPMPLGEVASRVLLTTGSLTHVIDQLEKKGLVARVPCAKDRRVLYADLTEEGRMKIADIFPGHAERIRQALSGLSAEEQEQAIALLKRLGLSAKAMFRDRSNGAEQPGGCPSMPCDGQD
jgi:MarR family transcriptional regulator, 2-MHQ and catechol-resistance regulon repressor